MLFLGIAIYQYVIKKDEDKLAQTRARVLFIVPSNVLDAPVNLNDMTWNSN
jgi:hypothetical protein